MAAFSVIELLFALGLAATLAGIAAPQLAASLDATRASGAARYMASRLQQARMAAVRRNASVALKIVRVGSGFSFTEYLDGNRNGVLSADIVSGADRAVSPPDSLSARFSGVEFGASPGTPAIDPGSVAPGGDPIRLGASDMAVFSPDGTATSGTLFIEGRRHLQYAVRIYGETGRIRIFTLDSRSLAWTLLGP